MKKKGFTLIELLVVISIIAMLLAILMPALSKVKKIAARVVCGTNLKGLGTAQTVYAHDYSDQYVVQGGKTQAVLNNTMTGDFWQTATVNWASTTAAPNISVGTSLYLLVREADVSPKSFVCPSSAETVFDGKNTNNLDITALWDFGGTTATGTPATCVSYSYHMPYNGSSAAPSAKKHRYAADGLRSASFAVMADKSPWFDAKLNSGVPTQANYLDLKALLPVPPTAGDWNSIPKYNLQAANSQPHDRDGQNVMFADGHCSYENRPDIGTKNDNIYTPWDLAIGGTLPTNTENPWRIGTLTGAPLAFYGRGTDDSVLVNDGKWQ